MRFVVAALLAGLVALAGGTGTAGGREPVHALLFQGQTVSLASLDATTLAQQGRQLAIGRAHGSVSTDRLGSRLAIASAGAGIVVVDTRQMRVVWRLARGRLIRAVAWLSPSRLLVVEHGGALLLDPSRRRIVGHTRFEGVVLDTVRWSQGLVALASRNEGSIDPARLVVIGPGVRTRIVEVARIAAGWAPGPSDGVPFNRAIPGLAVDSAGRALVAGGPHLATIDLASLEVSYGRTERTLQKVTTGPRRSAAWLGDGILALSGADERWTEAGSSSEPFGLRYLSSAGVRIVDPDATDVRAAADLALAFGSRSADGRVHGIGLAAYGRDGALRWRLFGDAPVSSLTLANGLAYVWVAGRWNVVEVVSGTVLGSAPPRAAAMILLGS